MNLIYMIEVLLSSKNYSRSRTFLYISCFSYYSFCSRSSSSFLACAFPYFFFMYNINMIEQQSKAQIPEEFNDSKLADQQIKKAYQEHLSRVEVPKQTYIRADIINNVQILWNLTKIGILLWIIGYIFMMLPQAYHVEVYQPSEYSSPDEFYIYNINPFSRKMEVYLTVVNQSEPIDRIEKVQVFGMKDSKVEAQKVLEQQINRANSTQNNLDKYVVYMKQYKQSSSKQPSDKNKQSVNVITEGSPTGSQGYSENLQREVLKYYIGDIHVLQEAAYRIQVWKPEKIYQQSGGPKRILQEMLNVEERESMNLQNQREIQNTQTERNEWEEGNNSSITETEENSELFNETDSQKQAQKQQESTERISQQEKHRQQQQEQKKRKQQQILQEKKKKEEQLKRQEEEKRAQQQIKSRQIEKYMKHTNMKIEVYLRSKFSTVLELIIRYISILIIIYAAADNPEAPPGFAIICSLYANPLMFIQVSFPNYISNVIDSICLSAPLLYPILWLWFFERGQSHNYYTKKELKALKTTQKKIGSYENIEQEEQELSASVISFAQKNGIFCFKVIVASLVYFFNVLRLLHIKQMIIWESILVIGLCLIFLVTLWNKYLNMEKQNHRDVIFILSTFLFMIQWMIFKYRYRSNGWMSTMGYIILQFYGVYMIYLFGRCKYKMIKKENNQVEASENLAKHNIQ